VENTLNTRTIRDPCGEVGGHCHADGQRRN